MVAGRHTTTAMRIPMTAPTDSQVLKLAQWLSPAYPVGAFAYSHGLESAVSVGDVSDAAAFEDWLADVLAHGAGRSDAIFLAAAFRAADRAGLMQIDAQARAFAPSSERLMETEAQGHAFARITCAVWPEGEVPALSHPVALGYAARLHDLPLRLTARMYLQAFASNLVSAAIRLIPIGQTEGQAVLTALTPLIETLAAEALEETLDDLSSTAFLADIASMKHETQYSRLFRS